MHALGDLRELFRTEWPSHGKAWNEAIEAGIDVSLLERNLRLTPSERIQQHEDAICLAQALRAGVLGQQVQPVEAIEMVARRCGMQRSAELLRRLSDCEVEFVIVGDLAAFAHGASQVSSALAVMAAFTPENMTRLLAALQDIRPRGLAAGDLGEVLVSPQELMRRRNLYLMTDIGRLDVLRELLVGRYTDVVTNAVEIQTPGWSCAILGLEDLIRVEESVGSQQDLEVAAELREARARLATP